VVPVQIKIDNSLAAARTGEWGWFGWGPVFVRVPLSIVDCQ